MSTLSIAVALVFICNAVAIIMLAFMLFRILGQTKLTRDIIRAQLDNTQAATDRLVAMLSGVDRLSDRLLDANKMADQRNPSLQLAPDHLQKLLELGDMLDSGAVGDIESSVSEMRSILSSLGDLKPEGYADWQRDNHEKLLHSLNGRPQVRAEIEELKRRLDEANLVISDLRRANRIAEASGHSVEILQEKLTQQEQRLNQTKERAQKAEASAQTLKGEIDKLNGMLQQSRSAVSSELEMMREQLDSITKERSSLTRQLDDLRDSMKRTLLEKDFIEEKLLDLDGAVRETLPPPIEDLAPNASSGTDR